MLDVMQMQSPIIKTYKAEKRSNARNRGQMQFEGRINSETLSMIMSDI